MGRPRRSRNDHMKSSRENDSNCMPYLTTEIASLGHVSRMDKYNHERFSKPKCSPTKTPLEWSGNKVQIIKPIDEMFISKYVIRVRNITYMQQLMRWYYKYVPCMNKTISWNYHWFLLVCRTLDGWDRIVKGGEIPGCHFVTQTKLEWANLQKGN